MKRIEPGRAHPPRALRLREQDGEAMFGRGVAAAERAGSLARSPRPVRAIPAVRARRDSAVVTGHADLLSGSVWLGGVGAPIAELDEAVRVLFRQFEQLCENRYGTAARIDTFDNGPPFRMTMKRADGTETSFSISPNQGDQPFVYAISLLAQSSRALSSQQRASLFQISASLNDVWSRAQAMAAQAEVLNQLPTDEAQRLVRWACTAPMLDDDNNDDWPRAHAMLPLARQLHRLGTQQSLFLESMMGLRNIYARAALIGACGAALPGLPRRTHDVLVSAAVELSDDTAWGIAIGGLGRNLNALLPHNRAELLTVALCLSDLQARGKALGGLGRDAAALSESQRQQLLNAVMQLPDDAAQAVSLAGLGEGLVGFNDVERDRIVSAVLQFPDETLRRPILENLARATPSLRPAQVTRLYKAILLSRHFDRMLASRQRISGLLPMIRAKLSADRLDRIMEAVFDLPNMTGRAAALASIMAWPARLDPQQRMQMVYLVCNLREEQAKAAGAVAMLKIPAFYSEEQQDDLIQVITQLADDGVRDQAISDLLVGRVSVTPELSAQLAKMAQDPPDEQAWVFALNRLFDASANLPAIQEQKLIESALRTSDASGLTSFVARMEKTLLAEAGSRGAVAAALPRISDPVLQERVAEALVPHILSMPLEQSAGLFRSLFFMPDQAKARIGAKVRDVLDTEDGRLANKAAATLDKTSWQATMLHDLRCRDGYGDPTLRTWAQVLAYPTTAYDPKDWQKYYGDYMTKQEVVDATAALGRYLRKMGNDDGSETSMALYFPWGWMPPHMRVDENDNLVEIPHG